MALSYCEKFQRKLIKNLSHYLCLQSVCLKNALKKAKHTSSCYPLSTNCSFDQQKTNLIVTEEKTVWKLLWLYVQSNTFLLADVFEIFRMD